MKRTILPTLFPFLLACVTSSCASDDDGRPRVDVDPVPPIAWVLEPDVARFAEWTTGSFVATEDPGTRVDCMRMWSDRPDLWLFVEVRRRYGSDAPEVEAWRIERRSDSSLRVHVYDLPEPRSEFHGAWMDAAPLASIGPKDLTLRPSEALTLVDRGTSFQGGTSGTTQDDARRVLIGPHRVLWQVGGTEDAPTKALSFARVP